MNDYTTEELASRRRIAQVNLANNIKKMKAVQLIYDRTKVSYTDALVKYNKLDVLYAEKTKVIICKKKTKNKTVKAFNVIPKKLRTILKGLPPEAVDRIITEYEKTI